MVVQIVSLLFAGLVCRPGSGDRASIRFVLAVFRNEVDGLPVVFGLRHVAYHPMAGLVLAFEEGQLLPGLQGLSSTDLFVALLLFLDLVAFHDECGT